MPTVLKETEEEEDEANLYSNEDWAKEFENPLAVYIGRPIKVPITLNGKDIDVHG